MISTPLLNSTSDVVFSGRIQRTLVSDKSRYCHPLKTRLLDPTKNHKNKTDSVVVCGFLAPFFGDRRSNETTESQVDTNEDTSENDKLENGEEIVLLKTTQTDGSDASFIYRNGGTIDAIAANDLCIKNNWPSRSVEKLASALEQSYLIASIWLRIDGNQETDQLVAFGRVTSDHACNALIWDVMVDPEHQGKGLGKGLIERIVRTLMMRDITQITVFADKQVVKFYGKLGFEADPKGIKGMFWCPRGSIL